MTIRKPSLLQNKRIKLFRSKEYNYTFDLRSGNFIRWGNKPEDDPQWSPFGPEILDIEISEGAGCPVACAYCYKGNKPGDASSATNMSFDTFKTIFDKLPHVLTKDGKKLFFTTQIAFGITSVNSHPQLFDIFDHCREHSVIPNVTVNGADKLSDATVLRLVDTCGAIAVSVNSSNVNDGLNLIKRMIDNNASQINIHYVLSEQSYDFAYTLLKAIKEDGRLKGLNAIVFLGLKPKSRGSFFDILPTYKYNDLVKHCLDKEINFGFDSCSCGRFIKSIESNKELSQDQKKNLYKLSEPCESFLFSLYINCKGLVYPCSFGENIEDPFDLTKIDDFMNGIWLTERAENWRWRLIKLNRECPLYSEIRVETENI